MPSYKITPRIENVGGTAKAVSGFWGCLLLPDRQRKLPCREVARRMVTAWLDCNQWMPTPEQMEE